MKKQTHLNLDDLQVTKMYKQNYKFKIWQSFHKFYLISSLQPIFMAALNTPFSKKVIP